MQKRNVHDTGVTESKELVKARAYGMIEVDRIRRDVLIFETIRQECRGTDVPGIMSFKSKAISKAIKALGYYVTGQAVGTVVGDAKLGKRKVFSRTGKPGTYVCEPEDFDSLYEAKGMKEKLLLYFPGLAE